MAEKLFKEAFAVQAQMSRRSAERGRPDKARIRELRNEMRDLLKEARALEAQAAHDVLERSRIICGTLNGYLNHVPKDIVFQSTLIDEASQALNPSVLRALLRSDRVVMAGDHKQLPPTLLHPKANAHPAARPLFETLMEAEDAHEHGEMLKVQHRMSKPLMTFPSETFYDGQLRAHASVAQRRLSDLIVENQPILCPEKTVGCYRYCRRWTRRTVAYANRKSGKPWPCPVGCSFGRIAYPSWFKPQTNRSHHPVQGPSRVFTTN